MKTIKSIILKSILIAFMGFVFTSCEDDPAPQPTVKSTFFIGMEAATDPATEVLLGAENLNSGTISPEGKGFEQPAWMAYFTSGNKIIAGGYTSAPEYTSYVLKDEKLTKGSNFLTDLGIYAHTTDKDGKLLLMGSPRNGFAKKKIYVVDTDAMSINKTVEVDFGNDEENKLMSFPIDMTVRGNKLFVAYYTKSAENFSTPSANEAQIAVFNYPALTFDKVITDDRIPNLGRYYSFNTLEEDENGNIYTFASSSLACGFAPTPSTNSGILRIKNGETKFDANYHIDFETLSGGYKINDMFYVGNGKAVVRVLKEDETDKKYLWATYSPTSDTPLLETGIVDLNNKTFKILSGVPKSGGGWSSANLVHNGKLYLGVSSKGSANIYEIDVNAATAKKGATVKGNYAKAILKLTE